MSTSHLYKIGQKVRHIKSGQDYFIVGIKSYVFPFNGTSLLLHENKKAPSRLGMYASPIQVEVLNENQN